MRTDMFMAVMAATLASQSDAAKLTPFPAYDMEQMNDADIFAEAESISADSLWTDETFAQYKNEPMVMMDEDYFIQVDAITSALSALESATDAEWIKVGDIAKAVKGTLDHIEKTMAGNGQMIMNAGIAVAQVADFVTGGTVGAMLYAIKNSGDIIMILKKDPGEITMNDVATVAATIPILCDIVKAFSKAKDIGDRIANGDDKACYRSGWEFSPVNKCRAGRSKFLGIMCMDECPKDKGMVICNTFSMMCATPDYCNYFKEEIIADLIQTGISIAVVAGTAGGLGILTLIQQTLTLTEKFAHPYCGKDMNAFKAARKAGLKAFKTTKKAVKAGTIKPKPAPAATTPAKKG